MAQMDRLRILERGLLGSSSLCCGLHFFPFKVRTSKNSKSFHRVAKGEFLTQIKLFLKKTLTQIELFLRGENYTPLNSP